MLTQIHPAIDVAGFHSIWERHFAPAALQRKPVDAHFTGICKHVAMQQLHLHRLLAQAGCQA